MDPIVKPVTKKMPKSVDQTSLAKSDIVSEKKPQQPRVRANLTEELPKLYELGTSAKQLLATKNLTDEQKSWVTNCAKQIKTIESAAKRDLKPKTTPTRQPTKSGITQPNPVTQPMSEFAGWTPGELHSRVDASRVINQYVKANNLQNPARKTQIIPDDKLTNLLSYDKEQDGDLLFTTIQRLLKRVVLPKPKST